MAFLDTMQAEYDFELHDLSNPATYGGNEDHFWDGAHIDSVNADLLLEYLLGSGPRENEGL